MNLTLRNEDALAVDLLLDRSPAASHGDGGGQVFVSADRVSLERVHSAEKVLGLLKLMPVEEPAGDLVARTMGRLQAFDRGHRVIPEPVIHSPRPHA